MQNSNKIELIHTPFTIWEFLKRNIDGIEELGYSSSGRIEFPHRVDWSCFEIEEEDTVGKYKVAWLDCPVLLSFQKYKDKIESTNESETTLVKFLLTKEGKVVTSREFWLEMSEIFPILKHRLIRAEIFLMSRQLPELILHADLKCLDLDANLESQYGLKPYTG